MNLIKLNYSKITPLDPNFEIGLTFSSLS